MQIPEADHSEPTPRSSRWPLSDFSHGQAQRPQRFSFRRFYFVSIAILFLWLSADGRLHWDEPSFLYVSQHQDAASVARDEYQPSGIRHFTFARLFHILWVKAVLAVVPPGKAALFAVIASYVLVLLASLLVLMRLTRQILPGREGLAEVMAALALSPLVVHLAGKTMPEAPALLASSVACYALLRAATRTNALRAVLWSATIGFCLLVMVFTKNIMVLMYVAFAICLFVYQPSTVVRSRVAAIFLASGVLSLAAFQAVLSGLNVSLSEYLGLLEVAATEDAPIASFVLHIGLSGVTAFIAPLASFLSPHRKERHFFLTWLAIGTLPLILGLKDIETRYLLPQVGPLAGLFWLSWDGIRTRLPNLVRTRRRAALALCLFLVLLGINAGLPQLVMTHEVEMGQMDKLVRRILESQPEQVVILSPWEYSDFHYLRFVYPALPVYSVFTPELLGDAHTAAGLAKGRARFLEGRVIRNMEELDRISDGGQIPIYYVGFHGAFPIANLLSLARTFLPDRWSRQVEERISATQPLDQMTMSWVWQDQGRPTIKKQFDQGHYSAYRIYLD